MISSVATAAALQQAAQERKRRDQLLLGDNAEHPEKPSPSSASSVESALRVPGREEPLPGPADAQLGATSQAPTDEPYGVPDVLDRNAADREQRPFQQLHHNHEQPDQEQEQLSNRSPATPSGPGLSKKPLQQSPEQAPATAGRQHPPLRAASPPAACPSAPLVSRLVDAVLQLTNERFGASVRVQRRQGDGEVLQGVAEAVEESDRGTETGSVALSLARTARHSATNLVGDMAVRSTVGVKFATNVENVFKFDLMEDNPNWKTFLSSSTGAKAQVWEAQRQAARSRWRKLLYSKPRQWIYMTLSYPDHSRLAYWVGIAIIAIILVNTVTFCIESVPHYANTPVYDALT